MLKTLIGATTLIATALAWLLLAPSELGGQASFVVVRGASMEPSLSSGDLVIVRRAGNYQVGEVVTYEHPDIGPIIHRITGREGDRFVLQGDNNAWIDSYSPTSGEIIGRQWLHIPHAGAYLNTTRNPLLLALLSATIGVIWMTSQAKSHAPRNRPRRGTPGQPGQRGQDLLALIALLALGSLALGAVAFTRQLEHHGIREVTYEHQGQFDYTASAPGAVYDNDNISAGEPIFRALTREFDVHYQYQFETDAETELAGAYRLIAQVSSDNGWKRTLEVQPETAFSGTAFSAVATISLDQVQSLIDQMERETGVEAREYRLSIAPEATISGTVAGRAFDELFAPELEFLMDDQQVRLFNRDGEEINALAPVSGDVVKQPIVTPARLGLPFYSLEIATARTIALGGFGLALVMLAGFAWNLRRLTRQSDADQIQARYRVRVVDIEPGWLPPAGTVDITGFESFCRLADQCDSPIFRSGSNYFLNAGRGTFRYLVTTPIETDDRSGERVWQPASVTRPVRLQPRVAELLATRRAET